MSMKQKRLTTLSNLCIVFLSNMFLNSAIPHLFNSPEMLSSTFDKAKLFPENFTKTLLFLDDSGISLHVFPSRTNLKLLNISVTPKLVKKVITNHDLSKASTILDKITGTK